MQDNSSKQNQPAGNCETNPKTWQDVARQIIDEPDSAKLGSLVQELCEILDKTTKGPML